MNKEGKMDSINEHSRNITKEKTEELNNKWNHLLAQTSIANNGCDFSLYTKRDILNHFKNISSNNISDNSVICGFFFRSQKNNAKFNFELKLSASILGRPEIDTIEEKDITLTAYGYWAKCLPGKKYRINYNIDGIRKLSGEIETKPGINLFHIPIEPLKPLTYVVTHSHFDTEWRKLYGDYLTDELPNLKERIDLLHTQPAHLFSLDEECVMMPFLEKYPEYKDELLLRIKEGSTEIKGSIVSADLLMPLGEFIIRQLTIGEYIISEHLGERIKPKVYWNVDNYGINYQLPQILSKAGRPYFLLGEYNVHLGIKPPYEQPFSNSEAYNHPEFWLIGIDGSKVLTHHSFYGTAPFGPQISQDRILSHMTAFNFDGWDCIPPNKDLPKKLEDFNNPETAECKYANKLDEWNRPHLAVKPGEANFILTTPEQFFRDIKDSPDIPVIKTESWNENWPGSYESRVKGRLYNRRCEGMLLSLESFLATLLISGEDYPDEELRDIWYTFLINQHHDPQMTIMGPPPLFDEVLNRYEDVLQRIMKLLDKTNTIFKNRHSEKENSVTVFNPLPWAREEILIIEAEKNTNQSEIGKTKDIIFKASVPPLGWKTFHIGDHSSHETFTDLDNGKTFLENEHIRIDIQGGNIIKISEKNSSSVIFECNKDTFVNELFIWEDEGCISQIHPRDFMEDAKLLSRSSQQKTEYRIINKEPLQMILAKEYSMDWFQISEKIRLDSRARWIDFDFEINCTPKEAGGRRLRIAFPSAIQNPHIRRDISFAVLPWKQTKDIVPMNSWIGIDRGDDSSGAALLHNGPCSQQVIDNVLWQTLLRSVRVRGKTVDYHADRDEFEYELDRPCGWDVLGDKALEEGITRFTFRMVLFSDGWENGSIPRESLNFTLPLILNKGAFTEKPESFIEVIPPQIVCSAVKKADYSNDVVIRLYNPGKNKVESSIIKINFPFEKITEINFREEPIKTLSAVEGSFETSFNPYEIKTFLIK